MVAFSFCVAFSSATLNGLPQCSDDGPRVWPSGERNAARRERFVSDADCSSAELQRTVLCSRAVGILNASCAELEDGSLLAAHLDAPILPEEKLANIRTNGLFHRPSELAAVFLQAAREVRSREAPLRFLATNANNGWTAVLAAAFLHRTHKGGFSGVAFNDLKWEWACDGATRAITQQAGLSWRHTRAMNPAAEAALMSYHPHARSPLWQTAFSNATELMPVSWVGSPPPFDICWRMGQLGPSAANRSGYGGLAADLAVLVGWCRLMVYHGPAAALQSAEVTDALSSHTATHRLLHGARQVGGFTIVRAAHAPHDGSTTGGGGGGAAEGEVPFGYVNKTPPVPSEYFGAFCIEDMSGCSSHHHEERCGYPRGRDTLPLACLPTSPLGLCCEKNGAPDWLQREARLAKHRIKD